jgi:hypothetical protein
MTGPSEYAYVASVLELQRLRSRFIVGEALANTCPTDSAWLELMEDPDVVDSIASFAEILDAMTSSIDEEALTPEEVARRAAPHQARAMEALSLVAEKLGVDPVDLAAVLVY